MANGQVVDVLLLDLPLAQWTLAIEHRDLLMAAAAAPGSALGRLQAHLTTFRAAYGDVTSPTVEDLNATAERRKASAPVDAAYPVPRAARDDLVTLAALFEEVDEEARHNCPSLVAPPGIMPFRRWLLGELVRQIDGGIPGPWKGC